MQCKVLIIFYNLTFIHNLHDYSPNIVPYQKKISTDKSAGADSLWIKKKLWKNALFTTNHSCCHSHGQPSGEEKHPVHFPHLLRW